MKLFKKLFRWVKEIQVYALVGESGTGKSYRAKVVAKKYRADIIIDDGLLIRGDKIVAGHSAKKEKTFLAAVKVAVFDDKQHRDGAAKALQRLSPKRILILGTSEKMVNKIAIRLQIPPPQKIIRIEDIATRDEIETAIRSRRVEGKHVIPVPSIEVKRNYPQIFYDKLQLILKSSKTVQLKEERVFFEKSVVRPEFSKIGSVKISEDALRQLVFDNVEQFPQAMSVKSVTIGQESGSYRITMLIDVPYGINLTGRIDQLRDFLIKNIERSTGILVEEVNIIVDKVINPPPTDTENTDTYRTENSQPQ